MVTFTGGGTWLDNAACIPERVMVMSLPQHEQKIDVVSVEGLEDVFDVAPVPEPVTDFFAPVPEPITCAEPVPIEEAAALLGTSINALKKRLRKGSLKGRKIETKHGEKWFVSLPESAPVTNISAPMPEPVTRASVPVTNTSAPVPKPVTCASAPALQDATLMQIIENQAHQLKAAGDVIMYLRSQIEEKDTQLKLLTDSQHKTGWWARFSSWFMFKQAGE